MTPLGSTFHRFIAARSPGRSIAWRRKLASIPRHSGRWVTAISPGLLLGAMLGLSNVEVSIAAEVKKPTTAVDYRQFAMVNEGDASAGKVLFHDEKRLGCIRCHSVDGTGLKAGPDLASVGDQFSRRDLIEAIVTPSAKIAVGYGTTVVETTSGDEITGVLKQVTAAWVELMSGDGQRMRVPAAQIKSQHGTAVSLMPEGLFQALAPQEFSDLIEYLVSLKQADHALTRHEGVPAVIPMLAKPPALKPWPGVDLQVPAAEVGPGQPQLGLVWLGQVPGHPELFLAAHQSGRIWWVERSGSSCRTGIFADFIPGVFSTRGPNGLLGIAFHPQFSANRKYYVKHHVLEDGRIATVLDEREAAADGRHDSGNPPRRLLKIESVAEHHNGGTIEFGPDGFLYLGMGDSAPNFDPQGYGQDLSRLFGKMLRLDVNHRDPGLEYAIPSDNPFRGTPGARGEIWALGLREPFRFSFDSETGELWAADLGQERGDEVDIIHRGENFGWNVYEGFELFSTAQRRDDVHYTAPIFAGLRRHGTAMIGGRVYRGDRHSSFHGVYIFGDHQSRRIWGMTQVQSHLKAIRQLATLPQSVTSFAVDAKGGLHVSGYQGGIFELDFAGAQFE